jgi:hypothetical protein
LLKNNNYRLRRGDQEACYNLGRAFHLIGLLHLALPLYEQVLRMPSVAQSRRGTRAPALVCCRIFWGRSSAYCALAPLALMGWLALLRLLGTGQHLSMTLVICPAELPANPNATKVLHFLTPRRTTTQI